MTSGVLEHFPMNTSVPEGFPIYES